MLEILGVMGWASVVIGLGGLMVFIVWRLGRNMPDSPEKPLTQEEHEWLDRQW